MRPKTYTRWAKQSYRNRRTPSGLRMAQRPVIRRIDSPARPPLINSQSRLGFRLGFCLEKFSYIATFICLRS